MEIIETLFGQGKDLSSLQMTLRAVVVFIISLVLIRISGRRSFGMKTPMDNIIVILLGAILSRAVVGASPFLPIVASSFCLVIIHRILGWFLVKNKWLKSLTEGDKILLYRNGAFMADNLRRAMVNQKDIMPGVRQAGIGTLDKVEKIYMECTGEISIVEKK